MVGVTTYAQPVIVGIVLLIAVAYDKLLATRQRQRQLERGAQHG